MTSQNGQDTSDGTGAQSPEPAVGNEVAGGVSGFAVLAGTINGDIHQHRPRVLRFVLLVVLPVVIVSEALVVVALMPHGSSPPDQGQPSPSSSTRSPAADSSLSSPAANAPGSSPTDSRASQPSTGNAPATPPHKSQPAALSPGSVAHLHNASTDQCVSGEGSVYPGFGTCTASYAYVWTLRSSNGGTFELVNRASGNCLGAPYNNNYLAGLGPCNGTGGTGYVRWRIGSTTDAGQTLENADTGGCLAITSPAYGGGNQVMVTTCNGEQPQQLWGNGSP